MRLDPKMYPGDSIRQPETGTSDDVVSASGAPVVRSITYSENVPDFTAIEREARAAQSAWIASNLKSFCAALVRRLRTESNFSAAKTVLKGLEKKAA